MRKKRKLICICTMVLLLAGCAAEANVSSETATPSETPAYSEEPAAAEASAYPEAPEYPDRYWTEDRAVPTKENGLPGNYRTMNDEFSEHKRPTPTDLPKTDGEEPLSSDEPLPSRDGMDTLDISGSAEFSPDSFEAMVENIRSLTDGPIYVFDLRQETHGFANGIPISLYAEHNAGNLGLSTEEVLSLEKEQLDELVGTALPLKIIQWKKDDEDTVSDIIIDVDEVMTEQELCESQGVNYVRFACTDRLCPSDSDVDEFMAVYLTLPEDAWLHFHCAAGGGRTGMFMMIADMLRNPDVPMEDIIRRQSLLGSQSPYGSGEENEKKLNLLQRFYDYVQAEESNGFPDTFTEWNQLNQKSTQAENSSGT